MAVYIDDGRRMPCEIFGLHEHIAEEMAAREWTASDVAERCALSADVVERIITKGTWSRPFEHEIPELAKAFDISEQMFVNLFEMELIGHLRRAAGQRISDGQPDPHPGAEGG